MISFYRLNIKSENDYWKTVTILTMSVLTIAKVIMYIALYCVLL